MKIGKGRDKTRKDSEYSEENDVGSVEQGKNCQDKRILEIGADSREETGKSVSAWRWLGGEVVGKAAWWIWSPHPRPR